LLRELVDYFDHSYSGVLHWCCNV